MAPQLSFGGDYNPEQWPTEVWAEDLALMREAGVNLVSVGIFSWALVQPTPEERYEFGWFDRVLDGLAGAGIGAALATMTASPPPWLSHRYPEILPQRADGTVLGPGSRQHYCPSSPVYRDHAARLVEQVAGRYAGHPALRLWHVGNEYGCHTRQCFCEVSAADFRRWLRERYGDLDTLNQAWSTTFWSQRYGDWAEIQPPRAMPSFPNPAHRLDFARFSDDAILECYRVERDIIRKHSPDKPVTTNFIGLAHQPIDSYKWAAEQDVVSLDSYPDPNEPDARVESAFAYDLVRTARDGQPWLLMEQAPSAVNWRVSNAPKPPGLMRLWSWQAVAQGADAVMFFQWRQAIGGAEKFHSAMLPNGGADTRTHREIRALGAELARCGELAGTRVKADVALLHDWDSWRAVDSESHPAPVDLLETHRAHYRPLLRAQVACDVASPEADLTRYRLVVAPNLYLITAAAAQRLARYVHDGGHLLVSYFSGIVDECERLHPGGYPGPLRELLGLRVEEFWPLPPGGHVPLEVAGAGRTGTHWSEWIETEGAEVVATFAGGDLTGRPAITRHGYGRGVAWYLGTRPEPSMMDELLARVRAEAGVEPVLPGLPATVQASVRHGEEHSYLFLLNHGTEPVPVALDGSHVDLLAGAEATTLDLAPRGVAVLRRPA